MMDGWLFVIILILGHCCSASPHCKLYMNPHLTAVAASKVVWVRACESTAKIWWFFCFESTNTETLTPAEYVYLWPEENKQKRMKKAPRAQRVQDSPCSVDQCSWWAGRPSSSGHWAQDVQPAGHSWGQPPPPRPPPHHWAADWTPPAALQQQSEGTFNRRTSDTWEELSSEMSQWAVVVLRHC